MSIQKLGFIGLGLIGGSIAKTTKRIHPEIEMIARSGHTSTVSKAIQEVLIKKSKNPYISDFTYCDKI